MASGAGIALAARSRVRVFFELSAWALLAALSLHNHTNDAFHVLLMNIMHIHARQRDKDYIVNFEQKKKLPQKNQRQHMN